MLKNILNLDGAQALNKSEQKEVSGGMLTISLGGNPPCSICATAPAGTHCGPSHCPGICNGQGGVDRI